MGRRWRISFTSSSLSGIQAAVADGMGISLLPPRAATAEHRVLGVEQGLPEVDSYGSWWCIGRRRMEWFGRWPRCSWSCLRRTRFDLALVVVGCWLLVVGFEVCGLIRLIWRRLVTFPPLRRVTLVLAKSNQKPRALHPARRFAPGSLAAVSYGASRPPAGCASLHLATSATAEGRYAPAPTDTSARPADGAQVTGGVWAGVVSFSGFVVSFWAIRG